MKLVKIIPIVSFLLALSLGCTRSPTRGQMREIKEAVRDAQREAIGDMNRPFLVSGGAGGDRYLWRPPVIEYVTMPPMVVDGVYIQGGKTPVVVRAGFFELVREENPEKNVGEEGSTN